jgi:hypothetical protein
MKRIDSLGDTTSTFPTLRFAFSEPVEDEEVSMYLNPDVDGYHTELNAGRDTLCLIVTGMLDGATTYTASLGQTVQSANGTILTAGSITFSFFTCQAEQEPNDAKDTTRIFYNPVCGRIYPTNNDTDYYYMADTSAISLYLRSNDPAVLGLGFTNTLGIDTILTGKEQEKYLLIPGGISLPGYIRIFSLSSTGKYELGALYQ